MITKCVITVEEFERNIEYIKANFETKDGYVYYTKKNHSAGYIIQSNNFTFTDGGTITMFIKEG